MPTYVLEESPFPDHLLRSYVWQSTPDDAHEIVWLLLEKYPAVLADAIEETGRTHILRRLRAGKPRTETEEDEQRLAAAG